MTPYVETFNVNGLRLGIEDYEDGRPDHFMPHLGHKRYRLWCGGGGIGQADTIEEARRKLHDYATKRLRDDRATYEMRAAHCREALEGLGDDPAYLFRFEVKRR